MSYGNSPYWQFRAVGFTPAQSLVLARARFDVWFVPAAAVGL